MSQFDLGSIGASTALKEEFKADEYFNVKEEMKYKTEVERKFWDDWDHGAD